MFKRQILPAAVSMLFRAKANLQTSKPVLGCEPSHKNGSFMRSAQFYVKFQVTEIVITMRLNINLIFRT